jgi:hypothetical protein
MKKIPWGNIPAGYSSFSAVLQLVGEFDRESCNIGIENPGNINAIKRVIMEYSLLVEGCNLNSVDSAIFSSIVIQMINGIIEQENGSIRARNRIGLAGIKKQKKGEIKILDGFEYLWLRTKSVLSKPFSRGIRLMLKQKDGSFVQYDPTSEATTEIKKVPVHLLSSSNRVVSDQDTITDRIAAFTAG